MRVLKLSAMAVVVMMAVGCERKDTGESSPRTRSATKRPPVPGSRPSVPRDTAPNADVPPPGLVTRDYEKQEIVGPGIGPPTGRGGIGGATVSSAQRYPDPPVASELELSKEGSLAGYTLMAFAKESRAELLDHKGSVVHTWATPDTRHWDYAAILPNGDLIVTGSLPAETERPIPDDSRMILRLHWNGAERWRSNLSAHGNVTRAPDGRLAVLTYEERTIDEVRVGTAVRDDILTLLTPDGKVSEKISLYDVVAASPEVFALTATEPKEFGPRRWIDVLRANWVHWIDDETLAARDAVYAPTNVVVTCQDQNRVAIINTETRKVEWAWGNDELQSPHASEMLENGNVMIFDNGVNRRYSRILEVDPTTSKIVWQYTAKRNRAFFSFGRGSFQRFANGNTLICNSDRGDVFEVTPSGDHVWRLRTSADPLNKNRLRALTNAWRYAPNTVEAWISSHGPAD